jgi:hypothetical protein
LRAISVKETRVTGCIDAPPDSEYSRTVPVKKIQVGQVWRKEDSGDSYLVTKIYSEALTTFALLRKTGAEGDRPLRIKISHQGPTETLPGFAYAQEADDF